MLFTISNCGVNMFPVINGLVSKAGKVRKAYGNYEVYGASMGIGTLETTRKRKEIKNGDIEVSRLDIAYSRKTTHWNQIQIPFPTFCKIVDLCVKDGKQVMPLDLKNEDFDNAFLNCISAVEFTSVRRLAKKEMKANLRMESSETTTIDWDSHISKKRGFSKLNRSREQHIANEIIGTAKYRRSMLAVIKIERAQNVADLVRQHAS